MTGEPLIRNSVELQTLIHWINRCGWIWIFLTRILLPPPLMYLCNCKCCNRQERFIGRMVKALGDPRLTHEIRSIWLSYLSQVCHCHSKAHCAKQNIILEFSCHDLNLTTPHTLQTILTPWIDTAMACSVTRPSARSWQHASTREPTSKHAERQGYIIFKCNNFDGVTLSS